VRGFILVPGDVDWKYNNMRLKDMQEYRAAVVTNDSDELLEASFIYERAQFKNDNGLWRSTLEEVFLRESRARQVAAEQLNALGRALVKVQMRSSGRCIKMRHKPPEGKTWNRLRSGQHFHMTDMIYCRESESNPNKHQNDIYEINMLLNASSVLEFERERNKKLMK
jgi:hypothetical protein